MTVMMALGKFRFSIETAAYQELSRTSDYTWALQERLNRRPAAQFMGPGKEEIELTGTIFPEYRGGIEQIDIMRQLAEAGEPLQLVDGLGRNWGRYVIGGIREKQSVFLADGTPRKMEFALTLGRYGEDAAEQAEDANTAGTAGNAGATARRAGGSTNTLPLPPPEPPPPPPVAQPGA